MVNQLDLVLLHIKVLQKLLKQKINLVKVKQLKVSLLMIKSSLTSSNQKNKELNSYKHNGDQDLCSISIHHSTWWIHNHSHHYHKVKVWVWWVKCKVLEDFQILVCHKVVQVLWVQVHSNKVVWWEVQINLVVQVNLVIENHKDNSKIDNLVVVCNNKWQVHYKHNCQEDKWINKTISKCNKI